MQMATTQSMASPRAPRGKQHLPQSPAQAPPTTVGRQSQRKPRGNRAHNGHNQFNDTSASPSKAGSGADSILAQSAVFPSEEAQVPTGPRNTKKHTHSQPSIDRVFSPNGPQAPLTDSESVPRNPAATPAKIQGAYAGPTFHASPAPSALPIPKFLSRSVPAKTRPGPPTPPPEDGSDSADSPSFSPDSPSRAPIQIPTRNEDSPLDMLFKADKAERAKNIHGTSASANFFGQMHPPRPPHYQHDSSNSANGIFPIELDGEGRNTHISPPPAALSGAHRSVTDPNKASQIKDASPQGGRNDVMQDLLNRLSMSQKKSTTATPPGTNAQMDPESQRHETPSPFHDGRTVVRSASGPSTPQPVQQDAPDFFYGNKNLSPMFKAAKNDSPKRNSGLRTEITAESPALSQGMFQDFPAITPAQATDPNTFARNQPVSTSAGSGNSGFRHGQAPFSPPYQQSPHNRRTPGRQPQHPRNPHTPRSNTGGPGHRGGKAFGNTQPVNVPKPATSMMSFVPASVSAKQHSSSAPPAATVLPSTKTPTSSNTSVLEQDLKRMLNLKMSGDTSSVH
ncbi:hypothetical protein T440DRAFT_273022 [Plenodomus tracheiphilus IPT5]|uniref:Uncharacterized protein n=1 Tax=Plenodomus tracheiphilus IPT5 TaxID=1408161 RepID=A0A6A7BG32_9PLEO|nr:hypothetical protein T440DRAFT_273022 [Plenodomus tracheiphilus IPT5]